MEAGTLWLCGVASCVDSGPRRAESFSIQTRVQTGKEEKFLHQRFIVIVKQKSIFAFNDKKTLSHLLNDDLVQRH